MDYQVGNYIFRLPPYSGLNHKIAAIEWAFNLQHNMPMSIGLRQQIEAWEVPFPGRIIPTSRDEVEAEIPEPIYLAEFTPGIPEWDAMVRPTSIQPENVPTPPTVPTPIQPIPQENQVGGGAKIGFHEVSRQSALDGLVTDVKYEPRHHPQKSLSKFLEAVKGTIKPLLEDTLKIHNGVTFWVAVQVKYGHLPRR